MPVHESDKYGYTALHHAAFWDQKKEKSTDVAEHLLSAGADVNIQTNFGNSPLHWAAKYNFTEVAQLLVDHGADINLKNSDKETPLDYARGEEVKGLLQQLEQSVP